MKQQPRILYCDIYCPWKQMPPALLGTYRHPAFIYVLIFRISTSYWSIIFVDKIRHVYMSFFLFLSILYFSLLNLFRTKAVWCHYDWSIILPTHNSLFLSLNGPMYNLKIPPLFFYRTSFLLEMGTFFKESGLKVSMIGVFLKEHRSISWNELNKLSTEKIHGFTLPFELTSKYNPSRPK